MLTGWWKSYSIASIDLHAMERSLWLQRLLNCSWVQGWKTHRAASETPSCQEVAQTKAKRSTALSHSICSDPWAILFLPSFSFSSQLSSEKVFFLLLFIFWIPLFSIQVVENMAHTHGFQLWPRTTITRGNKVAPLLWPNGSLTSPRRLLIRPEMHHL